MYDSMDMIDLLGLIISFLKREIYCIWWSPVWPHISVLVALSALPNLELLRDSAVNNMGNFSVWWLLQYIASSVSGPAAQSCLMCLEPSIEFYQKSLVWQPKYESWLCPAWRSSHSLIPLPIRSQSFREESPFEGCHQSRNKQRVILCIFTGILDNDFCPLLSVENEFNDIPKLFTAFGKKQNIWLKYARNLAFIQ